MVYSADRIPGAEAIAAQNRLAALLSCKLKREYSEMCGFVRERMSLAIVMYIAFYSNVLAINRRASVRN